MQQNDDGIVNLLHQFYACGISETRFAKKYLS